MNEKPTKEAASGLSARLGVVGNTEEIEHKALVGAVNRVRILDGGKNGGWFIDRFSDEEWESLVDAILGPYKDA